MTQIDYKPNRVRTMLLVAGSLVVLGGAFALYVSTQPPTGSERSRDHETLSPATRPATEPGGPVPPGKGVWVRMYDKDGKLSMQFRGAEYAPRDDNTMKVSSPEVFFFLGNDQLLRVTGKDGLMAMQEAAHGGGGAMKAAAARVPTRGHLHDVKIELFEKDAAAKVQREEPAEPTLTAMLNNIAFDNETYRIATEPFVQDGTTYPGDQVPVVVTGEYEFEGKGLTIFWNDRDRRLESLVVAHGKLMVVRNVGDLDASLTRVRQPKAPKPLATAPVVQAAAAAPALGTPRPASAASVPAEPPTYRATFAQDVQITQGQALTVTANLMAIDFHPKGGGQKNAAPRPALAPTTAAKPTSAPATQPAPIVVEWTGKLIVKPIELPAEEAVAEGEAALRLMGQPVTVRQQEAQIEGPDLRYRTQDGLLTLTGTAQAPVKMSDPKGGSLAAESLEFNQREHVAVLRGKGYAVQPLTRNGQAQESLDVTWTRMCRLQFAPITGTALQIEQATIDGDVEVKHPQLNLRSRQLDLAFGPGDKTAARPSAPEGKSPIGNIDVKSIVASGPVWCELTDERGRKQKIECDDRLEVTTELKDKALYPRTLDAAGKVKASDEEQTLSADKFHAEMKPVETAAGGRARETNADSAPQVALDKFSATGHVLVKERGDATASGKELRAEQKDDGIEVVLVGEPAKVTDLRNRLEGTKIVYRPQTRWAAVEGKGLMQVSQPPKNAKALPPLMVTWEQGVVVNGVTNRVDVTGNVVASSEDASGAANTARAGKMVLTLVDKAMDDEKKPASGPDPGQRHGPADGLMAGQMDALHDKTVSAVTLEREAVVESTLTTADGTLLRRLNLKGEKVIYDVLAERVEVPGEGRLVAEDHREAPPKPDRKPDPMDENGRGTTAMAWRQQLTFDRKRQQAQAVGDVQILHLPEGAKDSEVVQLDARQVTATFEPDPGEGHAAGNERATTGDALLSRLRLKSALAEGGLHIEGRGGTIDGGERAEYNPGAETLTISGSENQPVVIDSDKGQASWA